MGRRRSRARSQGGQAKSGYTQREATPTCLGHQAGDEGLRVRDGHASCVAAAGHARSATTGRNPSAALDP